MRALWIVTALLLALTARMATAGQRFALVVGNNDGGPGRTRLWFAERDAQRVGEALVEMGGFDREQVVVLQGRGASAVRDALRQMEKRLAGSDASSSLWVMYYSGHAGPDGLELGPDRLSYEELRAAAMRSPAAVKVVLVDACQSGALTQVKGSRPLPRLDLALPSADDHVRGIAYVASTAVGESAQESAALGGSFFSHHLEVGLRGAADSDGDGVVTLTEAFRYTSSQTVVGTAGTQLGPQHPTYDVKMSGRGEVVLSDLRRADARLLLPPDAEGHYLIRGGPGVMAELAGSPKGHTLGLPAGRYEVQRRAQDTRTVGQIILGSGETREVAGLVPLPLVATRRKGGDTLELFAGPAVLAGLLPGLGVIPTLRMGASQSLGLARLRLRVDAFNDGGQEGVLRYDLRGVGASVGALYGATLGRFLLEAGPELGATVGEQRVTQANDDRWTSTVWNAGAVGALSTHITRSGELRLGLEVAAEGFVVRLNERTMLRPGFAGALLVGYGL